MHSQWELYEVPTTKRNPQLVTFHQSWIYKVDKRHSGKAGQLTLPCGTENIHSLVAGAVKMNFSLNANMSALCSESHTQTHTHTKKHTHTHTQTKANTQVQIHTETNTHNQTHKHKHTQTKNTCTHPLTYIQTQTYTNT